MNEIFNPSRVDSTFNRAPALRSVAIADDKATNYGVVRLPLLEHIYETLYLQRITHGNTQQAERQWPHAILPYRQITAVQSSDTVKGGLRLTMQDRSPLYLSDAPNGAEKTETLDVDAVFVATGYKRDLHETLLGEARHLMPGGDLEDAKWEVGRDYRVRFAQQSISKDAGVWLQGCCEKTHGVSIPASGGGLQLLHRVRPYVPFPTGLTWRAAVERHATFDSCKPWRRHGQCDIWAEGTEWARGWVGLRDGCVGLQDVGWDWCYLVLAVLAVLILRVIVYRLAHVALRSHVVCLGHCALQG